MRATYGCSQAKIHVFVFFDPCCQIVGFWLEIILGPRPLVSSVMRCSWYVSSFWPLTFVHGFLSLLLHCGFPRLTGDLKASSWSIMWSNAAGNVLFIPPEWRFGEASECGLEACKDFYLKNCQKARIWFCQGLRRRGAGNFKHTSSNQSE